MKKMIMTLMFVLCGTMMACIEDGPPLPPDNNPDAAPVPPDAPPTLPVVSLEIELASALEQPGQPALIHVERAGSTANPLTVYYTFIGGSWEGPALNWIDYNVVPPGSVTISPGNSSALVVIYPVDDNLVEGPESLDMLLSSNVAYTIAEPSSATVVIWDNDYETPPAPTLNFIATPTTIVSWDSSTLSWSTTNAAGCVITHVVLSQPANGTLVVNPTTTTTYAATCSGAGGSITKSVTVTVNPAPAPVCHGMYVTFTAAAKDDIDHCTGWSATGTATSLTVALQVNGGDGVCAITCPSKSCAGQNVLPNTVSGIWLPGTTADVPRWTTAGCKRLPDHPATEPDQAGGTWDKRCDLY